MVGVLAVVLSACDWPMFAFGPERTSSSPDTSISKDAVSSGSVALAWTASTTRAVSSPTVVGGVAYAATADGTLVAYDAAGKTNCAGVPKTCSPLWTAPGAGSLQPAVVGGRVYTGFEVFDAAGSQNCSGSPKTCQPLVTYAANTTLQDFVVSNGVVYVTASSASGAGVTLYAFDAAAQAGGSNCLSAPTGVCTALWTTGQFFSGGPLAVGNGLVNAALTDPHAGTLQPSLVAFDAAGNRNCSGTPKTCAALWTGPQGIEAFPPVGNGVAYADFAVSRFSELEGIDTKGNVVWQAGCGQPSCGHGGINTGPAIAVAGGFVYAESNGLGSFLLSALPDVNGTTGCSGTPKTCDPLWAYPTPSFVDGAAVANGVLWVTSGNQLEAFDAAGNVNCSGTPKVCNPLHTFTTASPQSGPTIANGTVYVGTGDPTTNPGTLYAFSLERVPPTTSVVQPSNNAVLSGTTTLAASASDDVTVSKVEFHLTGGSYEDTNVCTAVLYYGWDCNWNTTTVPNGAYTLNSVAYDPAGNVGRSANVAITVKN
ncbi:MAG: PQQ-binding-like beta-propeller repeat protein [Actinobacteria bacterium]|nr:PQQ-binding-like beta-propeller repeat protein [Actinomycetota bacterium]